jgi:hypothetical protein
VLKILQILVYVYFWKKREDKMVVFFIMLALVVESRSK